MKKTFLSLLSLLVAITAMAEIKLPALICNNMVLQQNTNVNIWGRATAQKRVTVRPSWSKQKYVVMSDHDGKWMVKVDTPKAGGPYSMTISDGTPITLSNILIGEVWVCSGQSNMEMPVHGYVGQPVDNAAAEILESVAYPQIRLFTVKKNATDMPVDDCDGSWLVTSPETVGSFSATGYFFGKNIYKLLGVPVGLITANWGGTSVEAWMSKEAIDGIDGINHEVALNGKESSVAPSTAYNGMICPIVNYTAKGFIWYQGEANQKNYADYDKLLSSMVALWRESWGDQTMPFYYVELAPYYYHNEKGFVLPLLVEAQHRALKSIPNSAISASSDIGHPTCVHASAKPTVGQRLAMLALERTYGMKGLPANAPSVKSVEYKDGKALLTFNDIPEEFKWTYPNSFNYFTGKPLLGFEMAGEDRKFYPATANHVWWKGIIELSCLQVPNPVAVRYAFKNVHDGNVVTTLGLPLTPFRSDAWDVVLK